MKIVSHFADQPSPVADFLQYRQKPEQMPFPEFCTCIRQLQDYYYILPVQLNATIITFLIAES
jgi:hypothetical protein